MVDLSTIVVRDSDKKIINSKDYSLLKLEWGNVTIVDLSTEDSNYPYLDLDIIGYLQEIEIDSNNEEIVPKNEIEKIHLLLKRWKPSSYMNNP